MTVHIDIELHPDRGSLDTQLADAMKALGFVKERPGYEMKRVLTGNAEIDHQTMVEEETKSAGAGPIIHVPDHPITDEEAKTIVAEATQRKRGQPAPGKQRRTKAEIAEDDAADKRDAELKAAGEETGAIVADKHVEDGEVAGISTGDARVDPDNPADQAQDAADEAAETEAAKAASDKKLTHDDFRMALNAYVKKYGMPAAQADAPVLIAKVLGKEHDPAKPLKTSDIPEDQLARAVAGAGEMAEKNPFKRQAVA